MLLKGCNEILCVVGDIGVVDGLQQMMLGPKIFFKQICCFSSGIWFTTDLLTSDRYFRHSCIVYLSLRKI